MIRICPNCTPHPFQDSLYGWKFRVKNHCDEGYRCTVCLAVEKVDAPKTKPAKPPAKTEA